MKHWIETEIQTYVAAYPCRKTTQTRWGEPLVGFANAADPLFGRLREVVRPSHAIPSDLLPGARTVIVYFLPFGKEIARGNWHHTHASMGWAVAYVETNRLIIDINTHLAERLVAKGFKTTNMPPTHNFDTEQLMSDWSHKHVAYIAGLGGFGAHHLLITDKGCCGRLGSLVTDAAIDPSPRSGSEYCLNRHNGTCLVCADKCVTGALTADDFDRHKCYALLLENAEIHQSEGLADVCGKCTCITPCSFKNPVKTVPN